MQHDCHLHLHHGQAHPDQPEAQQIPSSLHKTIAIVKTWDLVKFTTPRNATTFTTPRFVINETATWELWQLQRLTFCTYLRKSKSSPRHSHDNHLKLYTSKMMATVVSPRTIKPKRLRWNTIRSLGQERKGLHES